MTHFPGPKPVRGTVTAADSILRAHDEGCGHPDTGCIAPSKAYAEKLDDDAVVRQLFRDAGLHLSLDGIRFQGHCQIDSFLGILENLPHLA